MAIATQPGKAELKVDGAFYGGWKTLRVSRSIEQVAGTFELGVTERWAGQPEASPIRPGRPCQVLLDGEPVITGYIDAVEPSYDAANHGIRASGRDKTGDLVDCSAVFKGGQWHGGVTLYRIAKDLCTPFGIQVRDDVKVRTVLKGHGIEPGETVFECLERAARMQAVLLVSNPTGDLVITRASKTIIPVELVEGVNILAASGDFSWKERHSSYTLKGHDRIGPDGDGAAELASPSVTAIDLTIDRYRPKVVLAEAHGHSATFRDRAEWEKNVRAGRGNRGTITVQGWRHASGALWQPNTLVRVRSPMLWLDADMLIVGCTYMLDERGTRTELSIARHEAFELVGGIGSSRLSRKLNDKEQREKKKKGDGWL